MTASQITRRLEILEGQIVRPDVSTPDFVIWFVEAEEGRPTGRVTCARHSGGRLIEEEEITVPVEELLARKPRE
jgi:hypothetical protein